MLPLKTQPRVFVWAPETGLGGLWARRGRAAMSRDDNNGVVKKKMSKRACDLIVCKNTHFLLFFNLTVQKKNTEVFGST